MANLKIELGDQTIAVIVDGNGRFRCEVDGENFESSTFDALKQRVKAATTDRRRCEVPATEITGSDELIDIVLTGKHSANGSVLYKTAGKKGVGQLPSYHSDRVYRRLTPEEKREFAELRKAIRTAQGVLDKWKTERKISAYKVVDAALRTAAKQS